MSISLLLALLETHGGNEPDRSRDYYAWAGAEWDGARWINPSPERAELILRELYDVLQATIQAAIPTPMLGGGRLGTVLARALTHDQRPVPPAAIQELRDLLKPELLRRFDALIDRHPPLKPLGA